MNKNWYYNNIGFRLASPLLLGIVVYMLVLLFFDSVDQLLTNFFSREVVFVILLTFVFLEINRLTIITLNRIYPLDRNVQLRIVFQFLISSVLWLFAISLLLYYYFIHFVGFSTILTELVTFNSIFFFVAICYNLYYFSLVFLYKRNSTKIKEESTRKETIELEMETFKNQVNPDFLFQCLEIIISELHHNRANADELVNSLALVYRTKLENKDLDLIPVMEEINSITPMLKLFSAKYNEGLKFELDIDDKNKKHIVPGTILILLENAIFQSIISSSLVLKFNVSINGDTVIITHSLNKKLKQNTVFEDRIIRLRNTYSYFSSIGISFEEVKGNMKIIVPLLEFDEE